MEWENSFDNYSPNLQPVQQYKPIPQQQPPQGPNQTTEQLMPNVYKPIMINEDEIEEFSEVNTFEYKKYITMFVLILLVYFILSLEGVKEQIGKIFSIINPREDGSISKWGFLVYGSILSLIVVGSYILIDRYVDIKF